MSGVTPQQKQPFLFLTLAGVTILVTSLVLFPVRTTAIYAAILLPALALLAEFFPVELGPRGLRLTFSLPFVAGMAVAAGVGAALLTDLMVTCFAALALSSWRRVKVSPRWLTANLSISALSSGAGGIAYLAVSQIPDGFGRSSLSALAFTLCYGLVNIALVVFMDRLVQGNTTRETLGQALNANRLSGFAYALLSISVAVLVHRELYAIVPLTLVPVFAMRSSMVLRRRLDDHYYETISALSLMLQRAHPYTHGHIERVAMVAENVALDLGLPRDRARLVREASLLHDIGKIAIDEEILDKPGKLTAEEYDHVKQHSAYGAAILAPIEAFKEVVPWIRHHHERLDGQGYPDGLRSQAVPIESRIIAVADAYDAMTGSEIPGAARGYRKPMTTAEAIAELERCSGTQFDPDVVKVFKDRILGAV